MGAGGRMLGGRNGRNQYDISNDDIAELRQAFDKKIAQAQPIFAAVQLKIGSGYYVRVTWPDGVDEHVNDFQSEAEAKAWIADESPQWIAKHPRSL